MNILGKLVSAPIKVAASAVRIAGMGKDVMTGQPPTGDRNVLDDVAEVVENDVSKIVGEN